MLEQNLFLTIVIASSYLIGVASSVGLSPTFRKCQPNDEACLPSVFTQMLQNSADYSHLEIPNYALYRPQGTWTLQTRDYSLLKLMTYTAHVSDISIYGLNNIQVHQFSGFTPNSNCTDIFVELWCPWIRTVGASFRADVQLLSLLKFPTSGDVTSSSTNVRIPVRMKSEIVERNGERYVQINDIQTTFNVFGDFTVDINFDKQMPAAIRSAINEQARCKWAQLKPQIAADIEEYICDIVHHTIVPIFTKVPIREFFWC